MEQMLTMQDSAKPAGGAEAAERDELALRVTVVYQDPVTRHWAEELWDRVGHLLGNVSALRDSWNITQLRESLSFARAVEAAVGADVVVISVRGAGELPLVLRAWIDAWVAQRGGRTGALVAIIGLPAQPDAQAHHTLQYFQAVARQAGLDFLPRERKLPEPPLVAAGLTARWLGSQLGRRPGRGAHWALTE